MTLRVSSRVDDPVPTCGAQIASSTDVGHTKEANTGDGQIRRTGETPASSKPRQSYAPIRAASQPCRGRDQTPESHATVHPHDPT
jgi:hypothetical protein